jgi:CubicO group peptidase (beta-lactamase class C family)
MAQFEVAMLNDRLVSRSTRDLMWTPLKPTDGKEDRYALGWGTGRDLGVLEVGLSGNQQGTSTFFMIAPEHRAGVVVLINLDDGHASDLGTELMKVVLASAQPAVKEPK